MYFSEQKETIDILVSQCFQNISRCLRFLSTYVIAIIRLFDRHDSGLNKRIIHRAKKVIGRLESLD